MIFTWFSTCPIKFHENWISIKDNSKPSYYEKWKTKRKIIQTEAKFVISIIQKPYYTYKCIYALYQSCNNGCNLQLKKKNKCKKPSSLFTAVNWFRQLRDMKITKLTLIDGENLREMNLVFPPHVAVYWETVGGDVGGVRSLFTQVLWDRNDRGRPRSQSRSNKTQIP